MKSIASWITRTGARRYPVRMNYRYRVDVPGGLCVHVCKPAPRWIHQKAPVGSSTVGSRIALHFVKQILDGRVAQLYHLAGVHIDQMLMASITGLPRSAPARRRVQYG